MGFQISNLQSSEAFFAFFAEYNREVWPVAAALFSLGVIVLYFVVNPSPRAGQLAAAVMSLAWLWVGGVFYIKHFAALNLAAPVYGTLYLVQGALVAWFGLVRGGWSLFRRRDVRWWTGALMMDSALVLYPLIDLLWGPGWPAVRIFGIAPAPTILFSLGLSLILEPRISRFLLVIPILAALIEIYAAWVLRIPHDAILAIAAAVTLLLWLRGEKVGFGGRKNDGKPVLTEGNEGNKGM